MCVKVWEAVRFMSWAWPRSGVLESSRADDVLGRRGTSSEERRLGVWAGASVSIEDVVGRPQLAVGRELTGFDGETAAMQYQARRMGYDKSGE